MASVNTTQNDDVTPSDVERSARRKKLFMRIGCMVGFCALLIVLGVA
jgi:phosphate/sulfate permease